MQKHQYILITGLPGSGKSYLKEFFRKMGKDALDADEIPGIAKWTDRTGKKMTPSHEQWGKFEGLMWIWDIKNLQELLGNKKEFYLFGNADNIAEVLQLFDRKYYLKADRNLLAERLAKRKGNKFGKTKEQLDAILDWADKGAENARKQGFKLVDASLTPEKIFDIICKEDRRIKL